MAENQDPQEGNIKSEYNLGVFGLNMDNSVNQIKKGQLTYALNASLENFDANSVNYQNEPGNEFCLEFPRGYVLIGKHFIQEINRHIFFLSNPEIGGSEIGYMDNNDCQYHTLVNGFCLNFNISYPIHKVVHKITNSSIEIYWTDGFNPRRYLDINNIPRILKPLATLCNPSYTDELDCNQLKLQPNFAIPEINIVDVISGGNNTAGTYQFAVQYSDASGNPYTSYYSVTNPTPIADINITTQNFNYFVGKSIVLNISNLDVTGQFQYFNLAVIKTVNDIASVELVGTYYIEETTKEITYTGQNVEQIKLSVLDIFEKYPYYDIAQDVTAVQDVLIWDQLSTLDRINYQSIASQISLQWETYKLPADENYANEINATNLRGYLRDEVYAFEIVFLLRNGKQTDSFHIPGRQINSYDLSFPDVPNTNPDFVGEGTFAPYWKIYNTATVIGPSTSPNIGNATAYQYGEFGYWESSETYPCNESLWGDLAGQPIRHHKFPDVEISPIFESGVITSGPGFSPVMQKNSVYPIGVRIDTQQVLKLINDSDLTDQQKYDIVGFKIVRGNRGTNKSIVAKGILRNVGEYQRQDQTYYFPNYPYNDLGEDPFITQNNNAYQQDCKVWEIRVNMLSPGINGEEDFIEVLYTSCDTGKQSKKKIYKSEIISNSVNPYKVYATLRVEPLWIGKFEFCSLSKPVILSPINGPEYFSIGQTTYTTPQNVVGEASYDIYRVKPSGARGLEVGWLHPFLGYKTAWLTGWPNSEQVDIMVLKNTSPSKTGGKGKLSSIKVTEISPTKDCSNPIDLDAFSNSEIKYRQVFNSPETSFGQPFLGNVLKLESVMFGAGKAHFVEVKNNAKYKLLSKEAQRDALDSSAAIGGFTSPFNATATFTAYQAYLAIYINGITRKNYAYSFNSIASYDYSVSVPSGIGIKQRALDLRQYIIPGVQSVGDIHTINNWNRESSVYLRTDITKTSLPLPSDSPNCASVGIKEYSRFTIGETNACSTPGKEQDIRVVSYYASIKNVFPGQWGQIYSYDTVDTGYQFIKDNDVPGTVCVFGGDTFISRFAFKTKLPFFIDNRVGAPDDSDIFYDEIGNVGYPKYWHSARSILENYSMAGIPLYNFISYKAHNFDCPNDPASVPRVDISAAYGSYRTFYDGYFYLFAYGIPNFYCESSYNTDLRQAFNNKEGDFWPHVSTSIPDDWVQESFVSIANDNTYYYNVSFSKQNKENTFTHLPPDWNNATYTNYEFRAIYSEPQVNNADVRVNNWLIYRPLSLFDFPKNYGKLTSLDGIQNKAVLARFENKSLLYNNLLTIDTSNPQAAYIGNNKMFTGAPPIDFAETDLGYVGSQNKFLLKIPQGQITVDAKRGQIFLISGTEAVDLTAFGSGINRFMTDHLAFEILRYYPNVPTDNHFNGIGLHGVYDSKFDRVIVTKIDYIPLDKDIKYDAELNQFYIETEKNGYVFRTDIYLTDKEFFCNKSWTLSFNMNTKTWTSFHTYLPNFYIGENNFFYSGLNGCCSDLEGEFSALVGDQNKVIPTTTTTTSMFTTTSTTTIFIDCDLIGEVIQVSCDLEGSAIVTVPPTTTTTICTRPEGLLTFYLIYAYEIAPNPQVDTYTSFDNACEGLSLFNSTDIETNPDIFKVLYTSAQSLQLGESVYLGGQGETDCTFISDGYYFDEASSDTGTIYRVEGGGIIEVLNCDCGTTTTTTTTMPIINECCGILFAYSDHIYYNNLVDTMTQLNVPGYISSLGIAMTQYKLWSVLSTFEEWDITLSPFTATYNRSIAFPVGFSTSSGITAINDETLLCVDNSTTPQEVSIIDVSGSTGVKTLAFTLPANREAKGNPLISTNSKIVIGNLDTVTGDYYLTQYLDFSGIFEFEIIIPFEPKLIFVCDCSIFVANDAGEVYTIDETYSLVPSEGVPSGLLGGTQLGSCITRTLEDYNFTTSTTTSTTTVL